MKFARPVAAFSAFVLIAVFFTGCNRSVSALETRSPPQPLPSVPLDPIETAELSPAIETQAGPVTVMEQQPIDRSIDQPTDRPIVIEAPEQTARVSSGEPVPLAAEPTDIGTDSLSREALAGTWVVNSDNPDCRIILAFTKWSGGYRAATRRCTSEELAAITAWDVRGDSVVLVDSKGQTVASLNESGPQRYDGATAAGIPVTFSR
jgi:Protease inhibitor Inh